MTILLSHAVDYYQLSHRIRNVWKDHGFCGYSTADVARCQISGKLLVSEFQPRASRRSRRAKTKAAVCEAANALPDLLPGLPFVDVKRRAFGELSHLRVAVLEHAEYRSVVELCAFLWLCLHEHRRHPAAAVSVSRAVCRSGGVELRSAANVAMPPGPACRFGIRREVWPGSYSIGESGRSGTLKVLRRSTPASPGFLIPPELNGGEEARWQPLPTRSQKRRETRLDRIEDCERELEQATARTARSSRASRGSRRLPVSSRPLHGRPTLALIEGGSPRILEHRAV